MTSLNHALLTMRAIDAAVEADQGASFRGWLGRVLPHIGDAYRSEPEDGFRSHLGASILGEECARKIFYNFRWVTKPKFEGRILRLFNRGHLEEGRIIAMLLMIGCQVFQQDANGNQYRISWAEGHAGGSGDGIAIGLPELAPLTQALCEFKTHGEKPFIELAGPLKDWRNYIAGKGPFKGKGVKLAKPEHFVQMQTYMRKMGIPVALYVAVNKNSDDLYMELITLDAPVADQFIDRGEKIVWLDKAPARINNSAGFFKCQWCDDRPVCHLGAAPAINCRTCQFSVPVKNAKWHCNRHAIELSKEKQLVGCPNWHRNEDI